LNRLFDKIEQIANEVNELFSRKSGLELLPIGHIDNLFRIKPARGQYKRNSEYFDEKILLSYYDYDHRFNGKDSWFIFLNHLI
jgi:hypothetical protein